MTQKNTFDTFKSHSEIQVVLISKEKKIITEANALFCHLPPTRPLEHLPTTLNTRAGGRASAAHSVKSKNKLVRVWANPKINFPRERLQPAPFELTGAVSRSGHFSYVRFGLGFLRSLL